VAFKTPQNVPDEYIPQNQSWRSTFEMGGTHLNYLLTYKQSSCRHIGMRTAKRSSDARYQALLELLRTADALWNASRLFFAQWNLSPSQFNVLNLLSDQPRGLSQIELGRLLITHRSNVTGLVDRLEKRDLLARHDAAGDRRAYRVLLTNAGSKLLQQVLPVYHALAGRVWDGTPDARARQLAKDLARLGRNVERMAIQRKELL